MGLSDSTLVAPAPRGILDPRTGKPVGSEGNLSCFSFHAVKNLAMGDGGRNLAESFYAASRFLKWKDVVIGDPLCCDGMKTAPSSLPVALS